MRKWFVLAAVWGTGCTYFVALEDRSRDAGPAPLTRSVSCDDGDGGSPPQHPIDAGPPLVEVPEDAGVLELPALTSGGTLLPTRLPSGLHEAAVAFDGKSIWLFGGLTSKGVYSDQVLRFDPVTERLFTTSYRLPFGRQASAAVPFRGAIYLIGGISSPTTFMTHIDRFDPATGVFTALNSVLPTGRYNVGAVAVGSKILIFGGFDYTNVREILALDPLRDTLEVLPTVFEGRESPVVVPHGSSVYVLGGKSSVVLTTIDRFDVSTQQLVRTPSELPRMAFQPAPLLIDGVMYLYGGDGAETIARFDPATERATLVPGMTVSHPHLGRAAVGLPGRGYVFGGANAAGTERQNTVVRFVP